LQPTGADSLAAALYHSPAVIAQLVLLTSEAIHDTPLATFDASAKSFGVGTASAPMASLLGERYITEKRNDYERD
jgi:hypothetical protein